MSSSVEGKTPMKLNLSKLILLINNTNTRPSKYFEYTKNGFQFPDKLLETVAGTFGRYLIINGIS